MLGRLLWSLGLCSLGGVLACGSSESLKPQSINATNATERAVAVKPSKQVQLAPLVVLDPGHGGIDGGTISANGSTEKEVALDIALRVERLLTQKHGLRALLTRRSDRQVSLAERAQLANLAQADLFISLHVNASGSGKASGFEAYYLDLAGDRSAQRLAAIENQVDDFTGLDDVELILSDLLQRGKQKKSILLAHAIEDRVKLLDHDWVNVRSKGVKKAPFYVLMGVHMPCVLLEMFFMDNQPDEELLQQARFRDDLAMAISTGIGQFLDQHYGDSTSGSMTTSYSPLSSK